MKWFGESWGAPCCMPDEHVATPTGRACRDCGGPIEADDQGFFQPSAQSPDLTMEATHLDCILRYMGVEPPKHVSGLRAAVRAPPVRITSAPADARVTCVCGTVFRVADAEIDPVSLHPKCIACQRVVR